MKKQDKAVEANTMKQSKVNKKAVLIVLNIIAILMVAGGFLGAIIMSLIFALGASELVPYYSFWPFVGFILVTLFSLIFLAITLTVTRKKSKHSLRYQTIAVVIAYFCLTMGFGILMDTAFPDVIDMATQGTLHCEDLYNNAEKQSEYNAKLVRDFIVSNLLNGSYGGDYTQYSYYDMSKYVKGAEDIWTDNFVDDDIRNSYQKWKNIYETDPAMYANFLAGLSGLKKELFDFIYNTYIFSDSDYALNGGDKANIRQCLTLAMCDKTYPVFEYLCNEGIKKGNRTEYLFKNHHASMDQDGYNAFDDPLLLFAQMENRMAVPVIVRLILNKGYTVTQPNAPENQSFLFEIYDPEFRDAYEKKVLEKDGNLNNAYTLGDASNPYGKDEDGNIIFKTGMVKKAMKWIVLDMLNEDMIILEGMDLGMAIPPVSVGGISLPIETIINMVLGSVGVQQGIGDLLNNGVGNIVLEAANGASLGLALYSDDNGNLNLKLARTDAKRGVLGYQLQAWLESNNLLFAVITLLGSRNTFILFGAIGTVLVLIGMSLIEYIKKSKKAMAIKLAEEKANEDKELAEFDNSASFAYANNANMQYGQQTATGQNENVYNAYESSSVSQPINNYQTATPVYEPVQEIQVETQKPDFYGYGHNVDNVTQPVQTEFNSQVEEDNNSEQILTAEAELFDAQAITAEAEIYDAQTITAEPQKEEIKPVASTSAASKAKTAKPVAAKAKPMAGKAVKPVAAKPKVKTVKPLSSDDEKK